MTTERDTIIRIVQSLGPSGRSNSAVGIHEGLKTRFPIELWALEEPRPDAIAQADRFFPHRGGFSIGLLRTLAAAIREARPAMVHTHGTQAHFYGILAARMARVRHRLATIHRGDTSQEDRFVPRFRNRITFRSAEQVLFMADVRREHFARVYGGPAERWRTIHVGVELDAFLAVPSLSDAPPAKPVVLCTGHLRPERDHECLFRAFAQVAKQFPDARLWLAGTGEEDRVAALRNLASELGISKEVNFLGMRTDIPELLKETAVVAHPARYDNLPRSVIEASAAARPVIATRVGGIPEAIRDHETGMLVPSNDPASMAEAMGTLLGNPSLAAQMGQAGRAYVSAHFSYDRMINEYSALYNTLLHNLEG